MAKSQRLFFAIWPDESLCRLLQARSKSWLGKIKGRSVPTENLHITLAFLGNVDDEQQRCLEQMAGKIALPGFQLDLNRLAYWPGPRVVWAGASETPETFRQLARELQQGARDCGLEIDRRPPVAHLTLKRKVNQPLAGTEMESLAWAVDGFYLVASRTYPEGAVYQRLKRWSLC